ncbi:hypothetical protein R1sor_006313 [Riccia sorocarpa]|uniref:Centlein n=1 Tax=Riccia sorocarpa TaxID=122646 RepID=A0ABD3HQ23_9MARC
MQQDNLTKKLVPKMNKVQKVTSSSLSDDEDRPLTKKRKPDTQRPKNRRCNQAKQTDAKHTTSLEEAKHTEELIRALRYKVTELKKERMKWNSDKASLTGVIESLRTEKDSVLQAKEAALLELQGAISATECCKKTMEKELKGAAKAQLEKDRLNDEISTLKFSLERAEKNQLLARQELAQARVQLYVPVPDSRRRNFSTGLHCLACLSLAEAR